MGNNSNKPSDNEIQTGSSNVYAIGRNRAGEFGSELPIKTTWNTLLNLKKKTNITDIKIGNKFNIYIDDRNNYWKAGNCRNIDTKITYFAKHNLKVKKICTSIHSSSIFWITYKKNKLFLQLYANGTNRYSQLGIGSNYKYHKHRDGPVLIRNPGIWPVVDVSMGVNYSIALCSFNINHIIMYLFKLNSNKHVPDDIMNLFKSFYGTTSAVYSTNYSEYGGNGHGTIKNAFDDGKWHQIEKLKDIDIIKINCGQHHSLFLDSSGILYGCGRLNYSQSALTPITIKYFVDHNIRIKEMSCGNNHNLVLSFNDKIYLWRIGYCPVPQLINMNVNQVNKILCGNYHSYICALDSNNVCTHYLFGNNDYNQCMVNTAYENPCPINILVEKQTKKRIKHVYLSYNNTFIITTP